MYGSMFSFLGMAGNYEERKIGRYEKKGILVSTCSVSDSSFPYETGVAHPKYKDGDIIVVENYETKEEAIRGHKKWVKKMTSKKLPKSLSDVSGAVLRQMIPDDEMEFERAK